MFVFQKRYFPWKCFFYTLKFIHVFRDPDDWNPYNWSFAAGDFPRFELSQSRCTFKNALLTRVLYIVSVSLILLELEDRVWAGLILNVWARVEFWLFWIGFARLYFPKEVLNFFQLKETTYLNINECTVRMFICIKKLKIDIKGIIIDYCSQLY